VLALLVDRLDAGACRRTRRRADGTADNSSDGPADDSAGDSPADPTCDGSLTCSSPVPGWFDRCSLSVVSWAPRGAQKPRFALIPPGYDRPIVAGAVRSGIGVSEPHEVKRSALYLSLRLDRAARLPAQAEGVEGLMEQAVDIAGD
jgi:hypothetical protein